MKYKSFSLIEVILALLISTAIASYAIKQKSLSDYFSQISIAQDTITDIINNGIISPIGYASNRGGDCSSSFDFENMTTTRLAQCNEWNDNDPLTTNDRFNIVSNALVANENISSKELMAFYGGCSIEVAVVPSNTRQYDIFVNCSNVKYNDRTLALIEESLSFTFQKTLSSVFISITQKAVNINGSVLSGDPLGVLDGKFRVRMGI